MAKKAEGSSGGSTMGSGFPDFASLFGGLKLPAVGDMGAFVHAHQRNMDTILAANRVAMEASQAYVRRHMAIMQEGLAKLTELMQTFGGRDEPEAKLKKQLALLQEARERTIAAMEELGGLVGKANRDVIELLTARFTEAIDELEGAIAKTGQHEP